MDLIICTQMLLSVVYTTTIFARGINVLGQPRAESGQGRERSLAHRRYHESKADDAAAGATRLHGYTIIQDTRSYHSADEKTSRTDGPARLRRTAAGEAEAKAEPHASTIATTVN